MSNFWTTSSGEAITSTGEGYEQEGGNIEPIPAGSNVLAFISAAGWRQDDSFNRWVEIEWTVEEPEEFARRKIWQKLWISDLDPRAKQDKAEAKRDKARKMLAEIDALCGGKLVKAGVMPTDDSLAIGLQTRQLVIKVMVYDMPGNNGQSITGNWVCGVFPKSKGVSVAASTAKPATGSTKDALGGDSIPF